MSPVNWVNPIPASTLVDKAQNAQQLQADIQRAHSEAHAARQETRRQTTVNVTSDGEKIRMDQRREERRRRRGGEQKGNSGEEGTSEADEEGKAKDYKPIHVTV